MTNVNPNAYTITVQEIEEEGDRIFEATISELPDAADYADTASEAYDLAIQTIETAAELYAESGRDFPTPRKREDEYSGRFTVRLPKALHAKANRCAEDDEVSLNLFFVTTIAEKVGYATAINHFKDLKIPAMEDIFTTALTALSESIEFGGKYSESASDTSDGGNLSYLKVVGK